MTGCKERTPLQTWALRLTLLSLLLPLMTAVATAQDGLRPRTREVTRGLPLPSRSNNSESDNGRSKSISSSSGFVSTTISLGLIVGTLLLVSRWMKRNGFQGPSPLPVEAFELLGRRMIEPKVAIHVVKCGSRILVLGVSPEGVRTLSQIDDPNEVDRMIEACQPLFKNDSGVALPPSTKSDNPVTRPRTVVQKILMAVVAIGLTFATVNSVSAQPSRSNPGTSKPREVGGPVHPQRASEQPNSNPVSTRTNRPERPVQPALFEGADPAAIDLQQSISPQQIGSTLKMLALMTVFSLAPSILMMTTCFVRFTVVLGLLRQALGTQNGPPNQVLTAIGLFLTFLVMSPIWQQSYQQGIRPYTNPVEGESPIDESTALDRTISPVRKFMSEQIDKAGNADAVWMLLDFQRPPEDSKAASAWHEPESYDEVPFTVLAPAYLLSELKVAFLIGFQLFLPFLVIDLVVATLLTSLGLTMLPPSMVSVPFKILLFVLIDGWFLTVGMLLESVRVV